MSTLHQNSSLDSKKQKEKITETSSRCILSCRESLPSLSAAVRLSSSLLLSFYLLIVLMGHVSNQCADNSNSTLQIRPVGTQRMWQDHAAQVHCGNPEDLAGENHRAGEAAGVPRPPGAGEDGGIHAAGNKWYALKWQFSVIASLCVSTLAIMYTGGALVIFMRQKVQFIPVLLLVFV